jgi:hypothetical protein
MGKVWLQLAGINSGVVLHSTMETVYQYCAVYFKTARKEDFFNVFTTKK